VSEKLFHIFRPLRMLSISNLAVGLGQHVDTNKYHVVEWHTNPPTVSRPYGNRSVATAAFMERCEALAEPEKERLFKQATAVPYEQASSEQKLRVANDCLEYMRLKTCDDEAVYADRDRAQGFTLEEAESYIRETLDAYTRQTAQEAAE
jgi:hypothetical protein